MQTVNDIRKQFLNYFAQQDHEIVDSSPLVPQNDPTLMFTNAGMVQFKNVFTGVEKRDYVRATTSQKCVRAGGKHNDLENVGYTARHHTFFEMLGNFSFGDYFKERAIHQAWELVTRDFGLPKEKLLVTVYSEDEEAAGLWRKIAGLSDDRIIRISTSDNFWAMGDTGPCGPCSEIFYDHGADIPGGPPGSPDEDGDRFIEIWNLVFMQYDQQETGRLDLPRPSIDTGMGLERIAAVMQNVHNNYDIDLFKALIEASAHASNTDPYGAHHTSHKVISDHLRASAFLISDGVLPSKDGRGYVLRRIMRRAMRHAHMIGCQDPLMWQLVPSLVQEMGQAYPELTRAQALITETLKQEEVSFKQTLDRGLRLLSDETDRLGEGQALDGQVAFKLYDTYGFPLDLTQDILRGQNRQVDLQGFDTAMAAQKAAARAAWSGSGDAAAESVWFDLSDEFGATEFLGYKTEQADGQILRLLDMNGNQVDRLNQGDKGMILVNQTPFYGESGGQQGDAGQISAGENCFTVSDTLKKNGMLHVHVGEINQGSFSADQAVTLSVHQGRRQKLRCNHSVTHLLHQALRQHLGDHVTQKGSLVAPDRLRFDFSHGQALSGEDIAAIEKLVNHQIRDNSDVVTRVMTPDDAVKAGALALFGEKYGDEVRVVSMGRALPAGSDKPVFSVELCGGTHVRQTGEIGLFKIISDGAVAAGIRRVEAMTGEAALDFVRDEQKILSDAAQTLKATSADLPARIKSLMDEKRQLEKDMSELRQKLATGGANSEQQAKKIGDYQFIGRIVEDVPGKELKGLVDTLKKQIGSGIVALISVSGDKASAVVGVTTDCSDKISAVDLVRIASAALGGKGGGGRPDMAQAGGPDGSQAEAAIAAIEAKLAE